MTIEHQWQRFAERIFHGVTPSATQFAETRKAFFAGAYSLLIGVNALGAGDEASSVGQLIGWEEEAMAFFKSEFDKYLQRN